MAYNPNPPYNPSDYGTHGRIDYDRMKKSLQETRDQIASFNSSEGVQSTNVDKALSGIANKEQPVYGAGVPVRESVMKDPGEYRLYTGEPPQFFTDRQADFKKSQEAFETAMAAMNTKPKKQEADKDKNQNKDKNKDKNKNKNKDKKTTGLKLPDLDKEKTKKSTKTFEEMVKGSVQNKNPSFDGMDFQDFLEAAKAPQIQYIKGMEKETGNPANPELAKVYEKLKGTGMSEDEMFKAAQYAGLTNVRTGKEGKSDYKQMLQMFENDFMIPKKTTKTEKTTVNIGMDEAKDAFGNKFKLKDYKAALDYENQDKKYIRNYLKDYAERGGTISDKVQALFPSAF
jgi:hypothetical protein